MFKCKPVQPIIEYVTSPSNMHEVISAPYTGVELPSVDGTILGDTAIVQYNNNIQAYYTWNNISWELNFIDNILFTKLRARLLEPCDYSFVNGQSRNIIISLEEFGGKATVGDIVFFVAPIPGFTMTYNAALKYGDTPISSVDNVNSPVTAVPFGGGGLQITSTQSISAYNRRKFAITLTATSNNNENFLNIILSPNTGGSVSVGGDFQRVITAP